MNLVWTLKLSSWRGTSIGAEHWYPSFSSPGDDGRRYRVEQVVSPEYAAELTAKDTAPSLSGVSWSGFKPGETTNRFKSKDEAEAAAIACWAKLRTPGDLLVRGEAVFPMHGAIAGPTEVLEAVNGLKEAGDAIGWWDNTAFRVAMDEIVDMYEELLDMHGLDQHGANNDGPMVFHDDITVYVDTDGKWIEKADLPDPYADEVHSNLVAPS